MSNLPPRLIDDPELSALARAVLRSADGDGPSAQARQAVARGLGLTVAGSMLASGGAAGAWSIAMVAPIVAAVLATAGAIGYVAVRPPASALPTVVAPARHQAGVPVPRVDAEVPPTALAASEPLATASEPIVAPAPTPRIVPARRRAAIVAPEAEPPAATPAPVVAPVDEAIVEPVVEPVATVAPAEPVVDEPAAPTPVVDPRRLAAEVALLDRARGRLSAGDAAGAVALIDQHARSFADGLLVAEAEVVRIDALMRLGRQDAARRFGATFLRRFPRSPLAQRVRSLLGAHTAP